MPVIPKNLTRNLDFMSTWVINPYAHGVFDLTNDNSQCRRWGEGGLNKDLDIPINNYEYKTSYYFSHKLTRNTNLLNLLKNERNMQFFSILKLPETCWEAKGNVAEWKQQVFSESVHLKIHSDVLRKVSIYVVTGSIGLIISCVKRIVNIHSPC